MNLLLLISMNIYLIIKKEGGKDGNIEQNEKFFAATEQGFVERDLHISCCCSIPGTQKRILLLNYDILEVAGKACNEGELGRFSSRKILNPLNFFKMKNKYKLPKSGQGSGWNRHVLHSEVFIGRVCPVVKGDDARMFLFNHHSFSYE